MPKDKAAIPTPAPAPTGVEALREAQIEKVQAILGWYYEGPESTDRNVAEQICAALKGG